MKKKDLLYSKIAICVVCSKSFAARYNIKRPKVCTPHNHKCARGRRNGKKVQCVARCCRSLYQRGAAAAGMNNAIDPRKVLSRIEFRNVWEASKKIANPIGLAIRFLAKTGCRLGEALGVRATDFEWRPGKLSIVRIRTLKREGHPERHVHLRNNDPFTKELKRFHFMEQLAPDGNLFKVPRRTLQGWISKLLKKFKPDRVACAHIFRHTHASQLMAKGVPVTMIQSRLGWSSLEMLKIYGHVDNDQIDKALA